MDATLTFEEFCQTAAENPHLQAWQRDLVRQSNPGLSLRDDLKLDHLDKLDFVYHLEERYDVRVEDCELVGVDSMSALYEPVASKVKRRELVS